MDTREMPPETVLPGHVYSLGEMRATIADMRALTTAFYMALFNAGIGSRCHAYIEFCGLQAKFIDVCQAALEQGVEFPFSNGHGAGLVLDAHHAAYLGEKFGCIFGEIMRDEKLRAVFIEAATRE